MVAGVVQVHWVMGALEELLGEAPRLASLEALKFHDVLCPGARARLRVETDESGARFRFSLVDANSRNASFRADVGSCRRDVEDRRRDPIYDHGSTDERGGRGARPMGLPCLLVDDGSEPATRAALEALAKRLAFVELERIEPQPRQGRRAQDRLPRRAPRAASRA